MTNDKMASSIQIPYTGGYLIVVLEENTLSEVVKHIGDRDVLSITRIVDE